MSDSLRPHGLFSPCNSPVQNTGVNSLSLLQGIFPTQGLNPGLPYCRWILCQLSHKGSPNCNGYNEGLETCRRYHPWLWLRTLSHEGRIFVMYCCLKISPKFSGLKPPPLYWLRCYRSEIHHRWWSLLQWYFLGSLKGLHSLGGWKVGSGLTHMSVAFVLAVTRGATVLLLGVLLSAWPSL